MCMSLIDPPPSVSASLWPFAYSQVAGFSAGFLAFARVALPVRAAVALAITPTLDKYVVRPLVERGVLKENNSE